MKHCSHCKWENDDARSVCSECGAALSVEVAPVTCEKQRRARFIASAAVATAGLFLLVVFLGAPGSQLFDGLRVTGSTRFREQVVNALVLLRDKSPEAYGIITNYLGVIKQARRSGMRSDLSPPTFELANPTAFYSLTWCAGSIAHDSMHSKMFHDYRKAHNGAGPPHVWSSQVEEEQKCIAHQLQVLRAIGAPALEIDHCAEQDGTHPDVNKDGKYDWDDYEKGNW